MASDVALYIAVAEGAHADPFHVCVIVVGVLAIALAGSPVQVAGCVAGTHADPFRL